MLRSIAVQRVHRTRVDILLLVIVLLRRRLNFLAVDALQPWRRTSGQFVFVLGLGWRLILLDLRALLGARLSPYIGPAHRELVGLADQPG
jgi:hypothetical protein